MPWVGAETYERELLSSASPTRPVGVSDDRCWELNPRFQWLYDRLQLAQAQELRCGPCGLDPSRLPVVVKPIVNLTGLSQGVRLVRQAENLDHHPGYFWCEYLEGPQYSVDLLVHRGEVRWLCASRCYELRIGVFSGFHVGVELPRSLRQVVVGFVDAHLARYTGAVNLELRDGAVIESHLRPSLQWLEFYGPEFVVAWARLADGEKVEAPPEATSGWSVPVYDQWHKNGITVQLQISSVYTGDDPWHPPGCHRTGYVNSVSKDSAVAAARRLGTSYL